MQFSIEWRLTVFFRLEAVLGWYSGDSNNRPIAALGVFEAAA